MDKLEKVTLDNGLDIYLYQDMSKHTTFFQFITLFGGIHKDFIMDNEKYHFQDGIAHILEHYIVECNESGNFIKELGSRQMNTNAATYTNMTRFYFETVDEVNIGIDKMLNGIYNVKFSDERLEKLKEPIYQEIRGRMDNKFYYENIRSLDNLFHKVKFRSIAGSVTDVEKATTQQIRTCYEAFYQPKNQFIVIAGTFNKDEVLRQIKDFYKEMKLKERTVKLITSEEKTEVRKKEDILVFPTPSDYVNFSFKIDISSLKNKELVDLGFYLGCFYNDFFGITSKLHKKLIKDKLITRGISCSDIMIENFLIIDVGAYTTDSEKFKDCILRTLNDLDSFDIDKFSLNQKNSCLRLIMRDESIMKTIMPFVDNVVNFKYPFLDTVKDIKEMSFGDYKNYIKRLNFSNYSVVVIKNEK